MPSIDTLLRPDIAALNAYTPIVPLDVLAARLGLPPERIIKLDANENPYGPSPRALAAMQALSGPSVVAIYPDPEQLALRQQLSQYTGQPAEQIICGAGADELIDLLMRAFLMPGDAIINTPPTFGMYAFDAGLYAARVLNAPRRADFSLDIDHIVALAERERPKMLFVTTPNNPTGNVTPRSEILRLLELPVMVVVDEAYIEFAGESVADLVAEYPNLAILRTFSKWAGLAGVRVGYGIVHETLIQHLWKIKQPYNVNVMAEAAARASLDDLDYLRANIAKIVAERERMLGELVAVRWLHVYPSQSNFILCRVQPAPGRPTSDACAAFAAQTKQHLEQQGILVRYYRTPELRDCLRFSIGTPGQNDALLRALHEIAGE